MPRKWLDEEFGVAPIRPMVTARRNAPRVGQRELAAVLTKAIAMIEDPNSSSDQLADALGNVRGHINFCRAQWILSSKRMSAISDRAVEILSAKYTDKLRSTFATNPTSTPPWSPNR